MNEPLNMPVEHFSAADEQHTSPSLPVARSIGLQEFLETATAAAAKIAANQPSLPGYHIYGYIYIPQATQADIQQIASEGPQ